MAEGRLNYETYDFPQMKTGLAYCPVKEFSVSWELDYRPSELRNVVLQQEFLLIYI